MFPALSDRASGDALTGLRRRLAMRTPRRDEDGFLLLESVMAIALTTLLLAALASFFASAVASTGSQRARQAATQLASSQMETIRALPASDLIEGRDLTSVTTQVAAASPAVEPALDGMTPATDPSAAAGSGTAATVPTAPITQVVGPTTYTVSTYLGTCRVRAASTSPCDLGGTSVGYLRAVVAVTWPGAHCPAPSCSYVTSTVLSPDDDPVFALNQAPPAAPVVTAPGLQTSTVGGPVDVQLAVDEGTGVPTMTWTVTSGALPTGLVLGTDGRVTGTPTGPAGGPTSVTVRVKDAFLRSDDETFSWRVVAAPSVTAPAAQTSTAGTPVTLPLSSTCPNTPCQFAMSGAPAGLAIAPNTGTITGTPTAPGITSNVTVTITDAAGVSRSVTFSWRVTYAPLVTTPPGPQKSTVGTPVTGLDLNPSVTGGSGRYTWSVVSGLPAGLSLSTAGVVSGTPTATTTGTVSVRVTDTTASMTSDLSFSWTVVGQPTVAGQTSVTTTAGVTKSIPVAYTCPYASCTVTLANGVPGVGLSSSASTTGNNTTTSLTVTATSGTVYLAGTVQAAAVPSPGTSASLAPVLTVADGAGAKASSTGSWRVYAAAVIATPGNLTATEGNVVSVPLAYTCPYVTCTVSLTGGVHGVGLSTSSSTTGNNTAASLTVSSLTGTVHLAGTVQSTAVSTGMSAAYSPKVTITDAGGTPTSATGSWTAFAPPTLGSLAPRSVTAGGAVNVPLAYTCANAPCTVSVTNPVPGVGLSEASGGGTANTTTSVRVGSGSGSVYVSGLVGSAAVPTGSSKAYATVVSITDSGSVAATAPATWTAYGAPTINDPGSQAVEPSQAFALQTTASCPNGGCTYTAATRATGSSTWTSTPITSTGRLSSTSVPAGTTDYRVTVTDSDSVTAWTTFPVTSQTFALTIGGQSTTKPTTTGVTKTVTLGVAPLVNPTADGYTYALSGHPTWLSINPSTGLLTATLTRQSTGDTSITVTVTSTSSATSTVSSTFGWTVS